jgi:multidrug resistance efflux pump
MLVQAQQAQATASAQTAAAEQQLKALGAQLDAVRSNLLKKEIAVGVVVLVGGLYALARARPEWVDAIRARFQRQ